MHPMHARTCGIAPLCLYTGWLLRVLMRPVDALLAGAGAQRAGAGHRGHRSGMKPSNRPLLAALQKSACAQS